MWNFYLHGIREQKYNNAKIFLQKQFIIIYIQNIFC